MRRLLVVAIFLACSRIYAVETIIKGGKMELLNQGDSVLFTDGVRLDRGPDRLESKRMQTTSKRDKVMAQGNVKLFRKVSSTETWQGFGQEGFYDTQTGAGYLLGGVDNKAHIIHTEIVSSTVSRVVHIYADRFDFFRETRKALAQGAVKGRTEDPERQDLYEFWSDKADFNGDAHEIILHGTPQPIVKQTSGPNKKVVTGDRIVYNSMTRRMISEGSAQAVFEDTEGMSRK